MYANALCLAEVQQARRRQAERAAANWHASYLIPRSWPTIQRWVCQLWARVYSLAQRKGRPFPRSTATAALR
jgi:hypothetical protein